MKRQPTKTPIEEVLERKPGAPADATGADLMAEVNKLRELGADPLKALRRLRKRAEKRRALTPQQRVNAEARRHVMLPKDEHYRYFLRRIETGCQEGRDIAWEIASLKEAPLSLIISWFEEGSSRLSIEKIRATVATWPGAGKRGTFRDRADALLERWDRHVCPVHPTVEGAAAESLERRIQRARKHLGVSRPPGRPSKPDKSTMVKRRVLGSTPTSTSGTEVNADDESTHDDRSRGDAETKTSDAQKLEKQGRLSRFRPPECVEDRVRLGGLAPVDRKPKAPLDRRPRTRRPRRVKGRHR